MNLSTQHKLQMTTFAAAKKTTPTAIIIETGRLATPSPFFGAENEVDAVTVDVEVEPEDDDAL